MSANVTKATLDMIKGQLANPNSDLMKAFTQSVSAVTGLTAYSLEAPAKSLIFLKTPIRTRTPRATGGMGIQANWRAVTAINTAGLSPGVAEGKRSGVVSTTVAEYLAAFRTLGLEDYVTEEAYRAGLGFQDVNALATANLLKSLMKEEERVDLGGNGAAVLLGKPTTPTVANVTSTAGTIPKTTKMIVYVAALTLEGYRNASVAGGIPRLVTRANAGPVSANTTYGGGSGQVSDPGNVTTPTDAADTHVVSASTPVVAGAVAYAWFWGVNGQPYLLGAITTINSVQITTPIATGTQAISTLTTTDDHSKNAYLYDGLLYQAWKSASGAYIYNMATGVDGTGTPLTADGKGGIYEVDAVLKYLWDVPKVSPQRMYVSSQEAANIAAKILTGAVAGAQSFRFNIPANQAGLMGGTMATQYLNKFGMGGERILDIEIHPDMPPGIIMFDTDDLPNFPNSGIATVKRKLLRYDYMQIDWARTQRQAEYGIYFDGVMQHYFPPAMALITNIGNG